MRRNRKTALFAAMAVLSMGFGPSMPGAEEAKRPSESLQLHETEIMGTLKEALGSMRLFETEILGSVDRPASTQDIPWADPDPWPTEEAVEAMKAPEELYMPLDRDEFDRLRRFDSEVGGGAKKGE